MNIYIDEEDDDETDDDETDDEKQS